MQTHEFIEFLWRGGAYGNINGHVETTGKQLPIQWFDLSKPLRLPALTPHGITWWFGIHGLGAIPTHNAKNEPKPPAYVRSQKRYITAVNCLYSELDASDYDSDKARGKAKALTHIEKFTKPPTIIIDSGGGWHCYWLLGETYTMALEEEERKKRYAHIERIQHGWPAVVGGDVGAKDMARVLRVPGTVNYKTKYAPNFPKVGFYAVTGILYSLEELAALVPVKPKPKPKPAAKVAVTSRLYDAIHNRVRKTIADMISGASRGAGEQSRYETAKRASWLAGGYIASGVGTVASWRGFLYALTSHWDNEAETKIHTLIDGGLDRGQLKPIVIKTASRHKPPARTHTHTASKPQTILHTRQKPPWKGLALFKILV